MMNYIEKHWKVILICICVFTVLVVIGAKWKEKKVIENATESKITSTIRNKEAYKDNFYYNQLSSKEKAAYSILKKSLDTFKGGEIEFIEPLNGREFTRVYHCIKYGKDDYFYSVIGIPMNKDNKSVSYNKDIMTVEDSEIKKCMLFLSSAKDVNKKGTFDDNGYVTNLSDVNKELSSSSVDKIKDIKNKEDKINKALDKVINDMPKDIKSKEAVDYFLSWMDKNLTYEQKGGKYESMSELFEEIYIKNGTSSVLEGKALPEGYAKVLSELCNRAGISAHVVLGLWENKDAYVMTCVNLNGEDIYVDASGIKGEDIYKQRYLSENETKNIFKMADYFKYNE